MNARDDIFNGSARPTAGSRNVVEAGMTHAACRVASEELTRNLASFCRRLDIAPALLNLDNTSLLILICQRQQAIIDDLAQQVSRLAFPPAD